MSGPAAAPSNAHRPFDLPSLDGIRAISVGIVSVSHLGFDHLVPGGFGVTVFFFLSGFLITTLLRREFEKTGTISFRDFYMRRLFRIFPPMYVTYVIALLVSLVTLLPPQLDGGAMLLQLANLANYIPLIHPGTEAKVPAGTDVYWSLAVEEHFYLVWPLLALALLRRGSPARVWTVLLGICVAVLAWRFVLVLHFDVDPMRTYRGTDTRFDSLLFGCLLALRLNPALDFRDRVRSTRWDALLLFASVAALLFSLLYRNAEFRETLRYTVQGLALAPIFFLAVSRPDWLPFRWLNWPIMKWIGTLSYTIYLSQVMMMIIAYALIGDAPKWLQHALAMSMTLLYAILMYEFVEKPCAAIRARLHRNASAARTQQQQQSAVAREA